MDFRKRCPPSEDATMSRRLEELVTVLELLGVLINTLEAIMEQDREEAMSRNSSPPVSEILRI